MVRLQKKDVANLPETFKDFEWALVGERMTMKTVIIKQKEESKVE
jgi:hypothetical protein